MIFFERKQGENTALRRQKTPTKERLFILINGLYLMFYIVKRTKAHRKNACVPLFLQRTLIGDM